MYFEINVSVGGTHFFATAERSITNRDKLLRVLAVFKLKFPESEGYKISVTKYETRGQELTGLDL